jgi:hypothetical protein
MQITIDSKQQTAYLINDKATPPTNPLKTAFKDALSTLLTSNDTKLLRWEGVWDGYSATPDNAPTP